MYCHILRVRAIPTLESIDSVISSVVPLTSLYGYQVCPKSSANFSSVPLVVE